MAVNNETGGLLSSFGAGQNSSLIPALTTLCCGTILVCFYCFQLRWKVVAKQVATHVDNGQTFAAAAPTVTLLSSIRTRRSVFPKDYVERSVEPAIVKQLLEAAMWAPFHGQRPPWKFVVLEKSAMEKMQRLTLAYYEANWREVGWANGVHGTETQYRAWAKMTEDEITGRWGPVSFFIGIIMRRQAGTKRLPLWEELAATACAVQNMHLQASAHSDLACYWSSWHDAARDSEEMSEFLNIGPEDRCLGFFIIAACGSGMKDRRVRRPETHLAVDWRD
jgi:nitroreductase